MDGLEAHRRNMQRLANRAVEVASTIPSGSILIDYPLHSNIGDLLIHRGELEAFRKAHVQIKDQYSYFDLAKLRSDGLNLERRFPELDKMVDRSPSLVFHGGGNLGDVWPYYQLLREALIKRYKSVPCVIMPQSAHFKDQKALARCKKIFSEHENLKIYCRDSSSFELLESSANCEMSPDMAHALWGEISSANTVRSGVLTQLRRDSESLDQHREVGTFDWSDCTTKIELLIWRSLITSRRLSYSRTVRVAGDAIWDTLTTRWIERAVDRLSRVKRLDTDRLHGMILAALLDTPVGFGDNSYGKLERYATRWFADDPLIARR